MKIGGKSVFANDDNNALKFLNFSVDDSDFTRLSMVEYLVVSLSLALAIAKIFPTFNNKIALRAYGPAHQSLYWGTVVICNIISYSFLYVYVRAVSIFAASLLLTPDLAFDRAYWLSVSLGLTSEVLVYLILFVGALIAAISDHNVPFPTGMARVIFRLSFCFCLCCCCCLQCSAKAIRVLILFSLMNVVYRIIMDAITIVYLMFIEDYRALIISILFLCITFFVFMIMCVSYILLNLRSSNLPFYKKACSGGQVLFVFMMFLALMLLVIMCIIIVFSLNLHGLAGVVTGLIPSVVLSGASWFIKKRLNDDPSSSDIEENNMLAVTAMNDLERGREEKEIIDENKIMID